MAASMRGVSLAQDSRFSDKTKQLQKQVKMPKQLDKNVDLKKIEMALINQWVVSRTTEILGFEDEVLVNFIENILDTEPNPRALYVQIAGFLEEKTLEFVVELWELLTSAEENGGIPTKFVKQQQAAMRERMVCRSSSL
mmetsp:Transcript_2389/g.8517  ORF Transcript_2389/g.8517 Transcript_2389/m.8517 type:complete len:139 (-) Transcript_2389:822-1238(-)